VDSLSDREKEGRRRFRFWGPDKLSSPSPYKEHGRTGACRESKDNTKKLWNWESQSFLVFQPFPRSRAPPCVLVFQTLPPQAFFGSTTRNPATLPGCSLRSDPTDPGPRRRL
jgi:hypothetical protein